MHTMDDEALFFLLSLFVSDLSLFLSLSLSKDNE